MYTQWKLSKPLCTESDYTEPSSGSNHITSTPYHVSSEEKLNIVFETLSRYGWTLADFLHALFTPIQKNHSTNMSTETRVMQNRHRQFVLKFLSGASCYTALDIVIMMFQHPYAKPSTCHADAKAYFSPTLSADQIKYAKPALTTWALEIVTKETRCESSLLVYKTAGLRVRAK